MNEDNQTSIGENVSGFAPSQNPRDPVDISKVQTQIDSTSLVNRIIKRRKDELDQSLALAVKQNADKVAEEQRLGAITGYGQMIAATNIDQARSDAMMIELRKLDLGNKSPYLASKMRDPNFAAISHDDVPNLVQNEYLLDYLETFGDNMGAVPQRFKGGIKLTAQGRMYFNAMISENEKQEAEFIAAGKRLGDEYEEMSSGGGAVIGGSAEVLGQLAASGKTIATGSVVGAGVGAGIGATAFGVGAIPGAIGGAGTGAIAGMALDAFIVEAGHAYGEFRENGFERETATGGAITVGVLNAALEVAGAKIVTAPYRKLLSKTISSTISRQVTKAGVKMTTEGLLKTAALNYLQTIAAETGTEVTQESVNILVDKFLRTISSDELNEKLKTEQGWDEIVQRIGDIAYKTATAMVLIGLPGAAAHAYNEKSKSNGALKVQDTISALIKNGDDSKLAKRSPDDREKFMAAQLKGKKSEVLYVDARELVSVLQQMMIGEGRNREANKISDSDLEAVLPGVLQQLAVPGVVDVTIPTHVFLERTSKTELGKALLDHIRVGVDAMSVADARRYVEQKNETIANTQKKIAEQNKTIEGFEKSAREVFDMVEKQLIAAGRSKAEAEMGATLAQAMVVTGAAKDKITPTEWLARNPLPKIRPAQAPTQRADGSFEQASRKDLGLGEQAANETSQRPTVVAWAKEKFGDRTAPDGSTVWQNFTEWFGDSQIVDADGKPMVVYHGTNEEFDTFETGRGDMIFVSPSKELAEGFGENIVESYIRSTKPFNGVKNVKDIKDFVKKNYEKIKKEIDRETDERGNLDDLNVHSVKELLSRIEGLDYYVYESSATLRNGIKKLGFDSIQSDENGEIAIGIFHPRQIKSAVANTGAFSTTNFSMLEQSAIAATQRAAISSKLQGIADVSGITASTEFAKGQTVKTGREFKLKLQERVLAAAKAAGIDLSVDTPETRAYLVEMATSDAFAALNTESGKLAIGWYNRKVRKALRKLALIHPEISTDPNAKLAFMWALAVTSNGMKVLPNFRMAEKAYKIYKKTGKMPTNIGAGTAKKAINNSLGLYNKLIKKHGFQKLFDFMTTQHTVKEVAAFSGKNISGENTKTIVYGSAFLGAKIGNGFFANLNGHFEQLTIDRWLMRTWGRWTGTLIETDRIAANKRLGQLSQLGSKLTKSEKEKLSKIVGVKLNFDRPLTVAKAVSDASTDPDVRELINGVGTSKSLIKKIRSILGDPRKGSNRVGIGDEIRKASLSAIGHLDGQIEIPRNAKERGQIRSVFQEALVELQKTHPDLTMADLQAVLWYPEKTLYESAKGAVGVESEYEEGNAPDYDNAAITIAREAGVSEELIRAADAAVDKELRAEDSARRTGRGVKRAGKSGVLRQSAVTTSSHNVALSAQRIEQIPLGGVTPIADVRQSLIGKFGSVVDRLVKSGRLVIASNASDLVTKFRESTGRDLDEETENSIKADKLKAEGTIRAWIIFAEQRQVVDFNSIKSIDDAKAAAEKKYKKIVESTPEFDGDAYINSIEDRELDELPPVVRDAVRRWRNGDQDSAMRDLLNSVTKERQRNIAAWRNYLEVVNEDYAADPNWRHYVVEYLFESFSKDNPNSGLPFNAAALSLVHNKVSTGEAPRFDKAYSKALLLVTKDLVKLGDVNNGWRKVPRTSMDSPNFNNIVAEVQSISSAKWCTRTTHASPYIQRGDFWVYISNGSPAIAIRFDGADVAEIQGPANDGTIPYQYAGEVKNLLDSGQLGVLKPKTKMSLETAIEKANLLEGIKSGSIREQEQAAGVEFDYTAAGQDTVRVFVNKNGEIVIWGDCKIIGPNKVSRVEGRLTIQEGESARFLTSVRHLKMDRDSSAPLITEVLGDAEFYQDTSAPLLTKIGGNGDILAGAFVPLLETINGELSAYAESSLPSLVSVGGNAFIAGKASLPLLKTVDGGANFYRDSFFPSLTRIGRDASFYGNASMPVLEYIGGGCTLERGANVPMLTTIVGHASMREGAIANSLQTIGENAAIYGGVSVPSLVTIGGVATIFEFADVPSLTTIGEGGTIKARASVPSLTTVGETLFLEEDVEVPLLATVGNTLFTPYDEQSDVVPNYNKTLYLPSLVSVGGSVTVSKQMFTPLLRSIGGEAKLGPGSSLPSLVNVNNLFAYSLVLGYKNIESPFIPLLETVAGSAYLNYNVSAPSLTSIGNYALIGDSVSVPLLKTIWGNTAIYGGSDTSNLRIIYGSATIEQGANVSSLITVSGNLDLSDKASAPSLVTVGNNLSMGYESSAPLLVMVGGAADMKTNSVFSSKIRTKINTLSNGMSADEIKAFVNNTLKPTNGTKASVGQTIQGLTDNKTGIMFLIASSLTSRTAPAVLAHEVTHAFATDEMQAKALDLVNNRDSSDNTPQIQSLLDDVHNRMAAAGVIGDASEALGYIVEEAILAGRVSGSSVIDDTFIARIVDMFGERIGGIVRDFVAFVRARMAAGGLEIDMTVDDMVAMAVHGMHQISNGDTQITDARSPTVSKSSNQTLFHSNDNEESLSQSQNPATFYSAFKNEVKKLNINSANAEGWKQQIKGLVAKGAIKQDEVFWSGLENWLDIKDQVQEGKITKEQVDEFLQIEGMRVDVQVETEGVDIGRAAENIEETLRNGEVWDIDGKSALEEWQKPGISEKLKSQYEALLNEKLQEANGVYDDGREVSDYVKEASNTQYHYLQLQRNNSTNYREVLIMLPEELNISSFYSSHWDGMPNVVVHIRMSDRIGPNGERILFIEEIQSDWGQEGRSGGFLTEEISKLRVLIREAQYRINFLETSDESQGILRKAFVALNKVRELPFVDENGTEQTNKAANWARVLDHLVGSDDWRTKYNFTKLTKKDIANLEKEKERRVALKVEQDFIKNSDSSTAFATAPKGPFVEKTSAWVELALKQIMLQAVNGKYDKVAFINGNQSAKRYDQISEVDEIQIRKNADGTYNYVARYEGESVETEKKVDAEKIIKLFGKERLDAADAKPMTSVTIRVKDFSMGGEGMKAFYDSIVPQALSKMLKKLGGDNVGEVGIDTRSPEDNAYYEDLTEANIMRQQGFTVTPALSEKVSQGLPLFQSKEGGSNGEARGSYDPIKNLMALGANADSSTFPHELMHWRLIKEFEMASDPNATAEQKADADILLKWFGIAGENVDQRLANWNAMSLDQQRPHHEAFALSGEIFLYTGKSPSVELQGVFEKYRRWLIRTYISIRDDLNAIYRQQFGTDLPFLTEEIRGVFDRMLASEEQISQREAIDNFKAQYQTQEESGMNDGEWAAYQAMIAEAHEVAVTDLTAASVKQMEWLSGARGKILKDMQTAHNAFRKATQSEEAEKMSNEPVRRAERFLRTGKMLDAEGKEVEFLVGNKLDRSTVINMYPTSTTGLTPAVDLTKLQGMMTKDGLAPDLAAEMFGMESGDQLVRALAELKPYKEELKERTDARMLEEHGELTTPEAREEAVQRALANEARSRFVAVENRFLTKAKTPVAVILQGAKELARSILGRMAIKDIKPRNYALTEARVAKEKTTAVKAMQSPETAAKSAYTRHYNKMIAEGVEEAKAVEMATEVSNEAMKSAQARIDAHKKQYGDVSPEVAAIKASHQQVIQNQLAKEAQSIKDEIETQIGKFKRFFKDDKKIAKTRSVDLVNAARSILAFYGLGKHDKLPSAYLEQLKEYNPSLFESVSAMISSAKTGTPDYRMLTVDEFRSMQETVDALWELAKRENQIRIEGEMVSLDQAVGELGARLDEIGVPKTLPGETQAVTNKDRAVRHINSMKAILRRVEHWANATDGANNAGGPFTKYIWRPISQALDAYRIDRNKYVKRYVDLLKEIALPVGKIAAPEINYTFGAGNGGIGIAELLGALMHTGNVSNLEKLLVGRGWATVAEDGTMDTSKWDAFIARVTNDGTLTKQHFDFLQAAWDLNEELKPMAQKVHHDIEGYYFKEVPATPFTNQFGTYRGGYVPAKTDPFIVRDAQRQARMAELESDFRAAMPSTGTGFMKSRVKYNKALSLDIRLMAKHIDDVIRYSHVQPAVKDVMRILKNRSFADKLTRMDSMAIDEMLAPWLNRAARQITNESGRWKPIDTFWRTVRSRTGISVMIGNITNAMQQLTGLFMSSLKVGPAYLGNALYSYIASPNLSSQEVAALSPFMSNKMENQIFDLQDQMNQLVLNPNKFQKIQKWSSHHGYFLQSAFQNMVDIVTWTATYNEYLAESGVDVSDAKAQREAINRADAAVRLTQGTMNPEGIAAFEVGTPFYKTFVQFTGYFNMLANLNTDEYVKIFRDLGWRGNEGKLAYTFLMGFAAQAIISDAIVRTLRGGWEDDDDDGYLDVFMDWIFGSMARSAVAMVPFGSTAYTALTTAYNSKPYDDRITSSPSVSALESSTVGVGKAIINATSKDKEITGQNVKDVATLISVSTGIPVTLLGRPASYLVDVERGKINPTSKADFVRGLITGTATKESKKR